MNEGEIRQQLGFDASQALDELARLNTAFSGFGNQLTTTVNRLNYFNAECRQDGCCTEADGLAGRPYAGFLGQTWQCAGDRNACCWGWEVFPRVRRQPVNLTPVSIRSSRRQTLPPRRLRISVKLQIRSCRVPTTILAP